MYCFPLQFSTFVLSLNVFLFLFLLAVIVNHHASIYASIAASSATDLDQTEGVEVIHILETLYAKQPLSTVKKKRQKHVPSAFER